VHVVAKKKSSRIDRNSKIFLMLSLLPAAISAQPHSDALRLKRLRNVLGYSQRELANEFRVSHGSMGAWESGSQVVPGSVQRLIEIYEEEMHLADNASQYFSQLETSRLSRAGAFTKLASSMLLHSARSWLAMILAHEDNKSSISAHTQAAVARNIVNGLGELKGLALKAGQALGFMQYALPEAQRHELTRLEQARPMNPALAANVVFDELGAMPREIFDEWSPAPFAVASIGQVHRARLKSGEQVAVKVQYPLIVETIKDDLSNAAVITRLSQMLFRGQNINAFIDELRDQFQNECDYRLEAANQAEFRQTWQGYPGLIIPRVFSEYSTSRVLVTEFVQGESLESFVSHATPAARQRAGEIIWHFTYKSAIKYGVFHADPHAGNFLFTDKGVAVLDFGCVKRLSPEFLKQCRSILRATLEGNRKRIAEILFELGTVKDIQQYDFDAHLNMMLQLYKPLCQEGGFRYTPEYAEQAWRAVMVNRNVLKSNAPKDWFMIFRLMMGVNWVLGRLGVQGDFRSHVLDLLYEPEDTLPRPMSRQMLEFLAPTA
jgi:predicted unusual protein kinase regulating ubiquinone biosynthesis (AarF/ABC1/UbiB family)/DNA-binding transcriptional regulator YiaG